MDLETIGQQQAPGYRVAMALASGFDPGLGVGSRLRLVWIPKGTGLLVWESHAVPVLAPALLCLDETTQPRLEPPNHFETTNMLFHPSVVNGSFTLESIRGPLESTAALDRDWLLPFLESRPTAPGLVSLGPNASQNVAYLWEQVRRELVGQPDSYWPCRARSFLLELLILVDRLFQDAPGGAAAQEGLPRPGAKVTEVLLHLHTHYAEALTLGHLCRVFHTNRTTLSQLFRRETGSSLTDYLIRLRLRVAASILRDTTLPIGEIAGRVGFQDPSYFGRAFAKHWGFRPLEYRQKYHREP